MIAVKELKVKLNTLVKLKIKNLLCNKMFYINRNLTF